jgi:hypothetical protein
MTSTCKRFYLLDLRTLRNLGIFLEKENNDILDIYIFIYIYILRIYTLKNIENEEIVNLKFERFMGYL